jgi:hypothetical protein
MINPFAIGAAIPVTNQLRLKRLEDKAAVGCLGAALCVRTLRFDLVVATAG